MKAIGNRGVSLLFLILPLILFPPPIFGAQPDYVGSAKCESCHKEIYDYLEGYPPQQIAAGIESEPTTRSSWTGKGW